MSHLVALSPSKWTTLKADHRIVVALHTPSGIHDSLAGTFLRFEQRDDETWLIMRTIGRVEAAVPHSQIKWMHRERLR